MGSPGNASPSNLREDPPRAALWIASAFGLGRLPVAPGTWGSLGGVALYLILVAGMRWSGNETGVPAAFAVLNLAVAAVGVWVAGVVAARLKQSDPGVVVIDEVSGQLLTYAFLPLLDWRWLLAGFLAFRAFDIWKPFPARQAESLRGGWGIMADDWIAGAYAALLLALGRWAF